MYVIGIIPARMGSSRFPGKPMEKIHGVPMVGHCYHRTAMTPGIDEAYVATCDVEIYNYIISIGGNAVMTSDAHTRATTRTAEALEKIEEMTGEKVSVVVMVQGDEPTIHPHIIGETISYFHDQSVNIVNIMSKLVTNESFEDENNVKVIVDNNNNALYYYRRSIPSLWNEREDTQHYMQTGIIAFRRDMLFNFNAMEETPLERTESIDMNRVLDNGKKIRMVATDVVTIGVDTVEDLKAAEELLANDPVMNVYLSL